MILETRKHDLDSCKQNRHIPACVSIQFDQCLVIFISAKYNTVDRGSNMSTHLVADIEVFTLVLPLLQI